MQLYCGIETVGWKLRFTCESVLTTKHVRLFCNHLKSPDIQKLPVTQEHYEELKWQLNDLNFQGYELITEELVIHSAGVYHFYYCIAER